MKTRRQGPVHLVILGASLFLGACDVKVGESGVSLGIVRGKASDEWTRTYTVSSGGQLDIVNVNGSINVAPASGSQIEVRALREVKGSSDEAAKAELEKLRMIEDVAPDRVKVEARGERASGLFGTSRAVVDYRIRIPAGLSASFKTENGPVRMENIDGRIVASTTNGGVEGRGISGSIDAATVNGGILMDLASVTGGVSLVTVNGGIRLELPSDVKAELSASAVNGGVSVDERFSLAGGTEGPTRMPGVGPKRLNGTINGGGPKVSAHTTNGGVRVSARGARGT